MALFPILSFPTQAIIVHWATYQEQEHVFHERTHNNATEKENGTCSLCSWVTDRKIITRDHRAQWDLSSSDNWTHEESGDHLTGREERFDHILPQFTFRPRVTQRFHVFRDEPSSVNAERDKNATMGIRMRFLVLLFSSTSDH